MQYTGDRLLKIKPLKSNINTLLVSIIPRRHSSQRFAGKVLILSNNIPMWIKVNGRQYQCFMDNINKTMYIAIGIKSSSLSSLNFTVKNVICNVPHYLIPQFAITDITDIQKDVDFYVKWGFSKEHFWFIKAKIIEVRRYNE